MFVHSVYFWSSTCMLNVKLGLRNLTNCLCGWNLTPERLSAMPSPLGNGNDCCSSLQGITVNYIPTDTQWTLGRTIDYDHKTSKSANLSRQQFEARNKEWQHCVNSEKKGYWKIAQTDFDAFFNPRRVTILLAKYQGEYQSAIYKLDIMMFQSFSLIRHA